MGSDLRQVAMSIFLIFITILVMDMGQEALTGRQINIAPQAETIDLSEMQPGTIVEGDKEVLGEAAEDPIIIALEVFRN